MASPSLFVSYSHRDTEALEQLRRFLRPLERDQGIAWWDDSRIKEGRDWAVEIAQALDAATAAVLLISQDFIDSEFIARTELPHLLARAEAGKLTILPVFLGHSTVELTSYLYVDLRSGAECRVNLTKYQGFGSSQKPLSELRKPQREKVYAELARRLTKLAGEAKPRAAFLELSQELEDAYRQKEELVTAGRETTAIDGEILALRRRIREGGQLNAGDFLADGRFKLIEQIGHGGFATVWKAYDRKTRQPVAVKVLHGQYAEDRTRRERFFRGARKMAQLQHPGIVRVIAEEGEDGGYRFFVMEHVGGGDLREAVLAERLTLEERLRILLEVGDVLDYAHHKGVIHRDVKPANILLDSTGRPKLTDFDLVRALDTTGGTRTEGMLGTFLYAAPEAMKNPKKTEATADVYSLGMTALFTIYGEDLPIEVMKDADSIIDDLSCSPAVKKALVTAVDWNRHQRFPSAAAFCRALNEALGPGPAADEVAGGEEPLIVPDDVRLVIVDPALPDSTGPHALPVEKIAELSNLIEKYPDARPQTAKELPFRLKQRTRLLPAIVDIDGRWLKPMLKPILVFLVLMGLVGSLVAGWYILHPKPTVAILGFEDLSEGVGTDWHASALSEILTVELTMDQKVRMVSEEWIAEVKSDFERESLTLGEPQGLTPETLEKLRSHLRADYLLLGTYRANSQAGEPRLRVDLRLQDTGDSDVPWQETFDSPDGDLFALATAAGNALRIWLDADALSPEERSQVRALFPAGTEALELYFQGRHRLRRLEALEARNLLEQAVELEPEHPRPQTALASALQEAGYPEGAAEAARRAYELAVNWPRRERLEIAGRYHEIANAWPEAAKIYEELYRDFPDIEYGLRLAEVQIKANEGEAALATLESLGQFELSERSEARIAFAESRACSKLRDFQRAKSSAEQAAVIAERIGAVFLAARARFAQGDSLEDLKHYTEALEVLSQVRVDFEKARYPLGVQETFHLIAVVHVKLDELAEARKDLERFLAYFENDPVAFWGVIPLCSVLIELGRVSAARALLETALELMGDSLGSIERGAGNLIFGAISQTLGDLQEAERFYDDALHLYEELDDNWSMALLFTNLGEVYFLKGRLDKAIELHQKALDINHELDDEAAAYDQFRLGKVRAAQGNLDAAGEHYQTAVDLSGAAPRGSDVAKIRLAQAELELHGSKNVGVAANLAGEAEKTFWNAEMIDEAALAQTFRIEALFRQGEVTDARKQTQIVLGHAERSESWLVGFATALLDARVRAASRQDDDVEVALTALDDLVAEAARRGFLGHAFEARLAQGEIEKDIGRLEAAEARLEPLIVEAGRQGYGLIVQRAEALLGRG